MRQHKCERGSKNNFHQNSMIQQEEQISMNKRLLRVSQEQFYSLAQQFRQLQIRTARIKAKENSIKQQIQSLKLTQINHSQMEMQQDTKLTTDQQHADTETSKGPGSSFLIDRLRLNQQLTTVQDQLEHLKNTKLREISFFETKNHELNLKLRPKENEYEWQEKLKNIQLRYLRKEVDEANHYITSIEIKISHQENKRTQILASLNNLQNQAKNPPITNFHQNKLHHSDKKVDPCLIETQLNQLNAKLANLLISYQHDTDLMRELNKKLQELSIEIMKESNHYKRKKVKTL